MLRKMMMAGLLAATVMSGISPAYAQRWQEGGGARNGERQDRGDSRTSRSGPDARQAGGGMRADRAPAQRWQERANDRVQAQATPPRVDRGSRGGEARTDAAGDRWRNDARIRERSVAERPQGRDDRRTDWRNDRHDNDRNQWRGERTDRRPGQPGTWANGRLDSNNNWRGSLAPARRFDDRSRWNNQRRWDNGWRQDRRYDWRSYRSHYGDRYRIGRYYAPRGWNYGYSRVSVGIFLNSLLFANNYWIDDPRSYRLPPAYGTLRWVRYYDDALLVDIRDGYVVDVIQDFFW